MNIVHDNTNTNKNTVFVIEFILIYTISTIWLLLNYSNTTPKFHIRNISDDYRVQLLSKDKYRQIVEITLFFYCISLTTNKRVVRLIIAITPAYKYLQLKASRTPGQLSKTLTFVMICQRKTHFNDIYTYIKKKFWGGKSLNFFLFLSYSVIVIKNKLWIEFDEI